MSKQTEALKLALEALENHPGNYKLSKAECAEYRAVEDALRNATTPPAQRTWVELTDEELDDIYQGAGKNDLRRAREVIAAFKERNT